MTYDSCAPRAERSPKRLVLLSVGGIARTNLSECEEEANRTGRVEGHVDLVLYLIFARNARQVYGRVDDGLSGNFAEVIRLTDVEAFHLAYFVESAALEVLLGLCTDGSVGAVPSLGNRTIMISGHAGW